MKSIKFHTEYKCTEYTCTEYTCTEYKCTEYIQSTSVQHNRVLCTIQEFKKTLKLKGFLETFVKNFPPEMEKNVSCL